MAGNSLFGRDDEKKSGRKDDDDASDETLNKPEAVRLIEPDKAAEVAEKGTTAKRRGGDIPKYGDRPASPPTDKKATIRLPLAGSADLSSIERPKMAPVSRPRAEGSVDDSPTQVSIGAPVVGSDPPTAATPSLADTAATPIVSPPEPAPAPDPDETSRRRRRRDKKAKDEPTSFFDEPPELEKVEPKRRWSERRDTGSVEAVTSDDAVAPAPPPAESAPPPPPASGADDTGSRLRPPTTPLVSDTGSHTLPHWTEPATGEVPKVIIGDVADSDGDQAAWDSFAGASPRYHDQHDNWDDTSITDLLDGDEERMGALAPVADDAQTQDDFLTLEDLEMPDLDMPRPPSRGSRHDPVRQGKAGRSTTGSTPAVTNPPPRRTTGSTPAVRAKKRLPDPVSDEVPVSPAPEDEPVEQAPAARAARPADDDTGSRRNLGGRLGVSVPGGSNPGERNVGLAVLVGVPMGIVAWLLFAKGPTFIGLLVITAVIFLSGAEFFAAAGTRRFKPVLPVGWAALIALPIGAFYGGEVAIPLILFLTVFFAFLWYVPFGLAHEKPLGNLSVTFFGVLWVGMFGAFAALIYRIGVVPKDGNFDQTTQGPSILIMAIAVSVASDAGAFLFGKLYGKRTFTEISPNKTIEGLVGGLVTAVVIVTIAGTKFGPFGAGGTFFFALCCGVASPVGDLAESLIKRDLKLKDMSDLIPGHGGVLDRFDALLFVLPVAYFVTRLLVPGLPYF